MGRDAGNFEHERIAVTFMRTSFWQTLTSLGDSGFLLPVATVIALGLVDRKNRPTIALQWISLVGLCGFVVMVSKLAFMGWQVGSAEFDFTGVSGHAALAACVWPVLLWAAGRDGSVHRRMARAALGWAVAISIAISRLALNAHSLSEVAAGVVLGTMVSICFIWLQERSCAPARGLRWPFSAAVLALSLAAQGRPAPTQDALGFVAETLSGRARIYTREEMLGPSVRPPLR